jgi:hypothetical protein
MMIQKSKDKPLQFDANLENIIIRTFEKRSKNSNCERAILYSLQNDAKTLSKSLINLVYFLKLSEF